MIALVIAAVIALALAIGLLLWPLLREKRAPRADADQARLAVIESARQQVEAAHKAGEIDDVERTARVENLYAQADAALQERPSSATPSAARPWPAALAVALVLPLGVIGSYLAVGEPGSLLGGGAAGVATQAAADTAEELRATIELADRLAERLASDKQATAESWVLLARTYRSVDRPEQASRAYREAAAREAEPADTLIEHASLVVEQQGKRYTAEADALIAAALEKDADNLNALAMAGASAFQHGDNTLALQHWRRLEALIPADSEDRPRATALVAMASGERIPPRPPVMGGPAAGAPAMGGPTAETRMASAQPNMPPLPATHPPMPADGRAQQAPPLKTPTTISGRVEVSSALQSRVPDRAWLFVFARAMSGPPLPIAAARLSPGAWPAEFLLDDANSMLEGRKLSSFEQVRLVARISSSGNAAPSAGDLEGSVEAVPLGGRDIKLVVDRIVQ